MPEVSGTEFVKAATQVEPETKEFVLEDNQNRQLTLVLHGLDRQDLFDHLYELPKGFVAVLMGGEGENNSLEDVDDPEDLSAEDFEMSGVGPAELLPEMDGSAIAVFEAMFAASAEHEDLTSLDLETLADSLSLEALLESFAEILELSLQDGDKIKRFRGAE